MTGINNAPSEVNDSAYAHCRTKSRGKREFEIGQWPLGSLRDEIYSQLDSKYIKDKKNGPRKRKYRERAKTYVHRIPIDGLRPFYIDPGDLSREIVEELQNLDYKEEDYVLKEVIGRIFDSIGEPYLTLSARDHLDWELDS